MIELHIETKHGIPKELEVASILQDLRIKYPELPIFTDKVIIESGSTPHSHPTLTFGVRTTDPNSLLKTFIHEQFHWYVEAHPLFQSAITNLKLNYKDLGDCNKDAKKPGSFWEHLIVCWNTRNELNKILDPKEIDRVYVEFAKAGIYPLTEAFVKDNFEKIKADLVKLDLVYEKA